MGRTHLAKPPKTWTSNLWRNLLLVKSVNYEKPEAAEAVKRLDRLEAGERWPDEWLPKYLGFHEQVTRSRQKKLPEIFLGVDGVILVSERFAELLEQFDLGQTRLHRMELREYDQVIPAGRTCCLLNIAEHEDCFVLDESKGPIWDNKAPIEAKAYWSAPWGYDAIAVRASAADGVDLWMDPKLSTTPFFSDRLARAVKAGKFGRHGLRPCTVIV